MAPLAPAIALLFGVIAVASAVGLAADPAPFSSGSAAVVTASAVILTVATIAGLLVGRARWARPASILMAAVWFVLAIAGPIDVVAVSVSAAASVVAALAAGPWLSDWLRRLPAAEAPPRSAAVLLVALTATPGVIGAMEPAVEPEPLAWACAAWALAEALLLARIPPVGLWLVRVTHGPVCAAAIAVRQSWVFGVGLGAVALMTVALVWRRDVGDAARPLITGSGVPIPPELVDPAIMQAAGLDDRGRPIEPS